MAWDLVTRSEAMQRLAARLDRLAQSRQPLLIVGETGAGKERVARAVHRASPWAEGPFLALDCGALAPGLLDAELFGHEPGAFTGARGRREGLLRLAAGGTLYLDEVGEMPPPLQARLLRFLAEGQVRPLGGGAVQTVRVRLVTSTQHDLDTLCRRGRFRRDLLFRLAVLVAHVPPLRERPEDLPALAEQVLRDLSRELGRAPLLLTPGALDALLAHAWPGNVRELENVLRAAALLSDGPELGAAALGLRRVEPALVPAGLPEPVDYPGLLLALAARERLFLEQALTRHAGNKTAAARALGVSRYALLRALRRLGLTGRAALRVARPGDVARQGARATA